MIEAGLVLAWVVNVALGVGVGLLYGRTEQLRERLRDARNLAGLSDLEMRVTSAEAKLRARAAEHVEEEVDQHDLDGVRDQIIRDLTQEIMDKAQAEGVVVDPDDARRDAMLMVREAEGR